MVSQECRCPLHGLLINGTWHEPRNWNDLASRPTQLLVMGYDQSRYLSFKGGGKGIGHIT